jgi:hypothetical protein
MKFGGNTSYGSRMILNFSTKCLIWVTVSSKIRVPSPIFNISHNTAPYFSNSNKKFALAPLLFEILRLKVSKKYE